MIPVPNQANIRLFVDALRSGEYQQGSNVLGYEQNGVEKFCCLGVATETAIKNGVPLTRIVGNANGRGDVFIYQATDGIPKEGRDSIGIYLHPLVQEFYGFNSYNPCMDEGCAGELNDNQQLSFSQIADAFERNFLAADTEIHEDED